jgi:hypothetical protein
MKKPKYEDTKNECKYMIDGQRMGKNKEQNTETQHRMNKRQQQTKLKPDKREKTLITNYIINIKY